jgi:hypothetical protein
VWLDHLLKHKTVWDLASSKRTEHDKALDKLQSNLDIREEDCINLGDLNEKKRKVIGFIGQLKH